MVGNSVPEEALRLPPPAHPASPPLPALSFPFRFSLPGCPFPDLHLSRN